MNPPSLQLAFLTGPVNPHSAALCPDQMRFLHRIGESVGASLVLRDYPYPATTARWTPTPLWIASLRNVRNFLSARRTTQINAAARASTTAMLAGANHTIILAGSCGLELLAGLSLDPHCLARMLVIAYGPVARHPLPLVRLISVRGHKDFLSVAFFPSIDHLVPGRHMHLLRQPKFEELCRRMVAGEVRRLGGPSGNRGIAVGSRNRDQVEGGVLSSTLGRSANNDDGEAVPQPPAETPEREKSATRNEILSEFRYDSDASEFRYGSDVEERGTRFSAAATPILYGLQPCHRKLGGCGAISGASPSMVPIHAATF